jgi:T5SS/PEP-CTERM-associated repeat protein/autotransporter-associated beta strand protein
MKPSTPAIAALTLPCLRCSSVGKKLPFLPAMFCFAVAPAQLWAQPISISGDVVPGTPDNPVWTVGSDLLVGDAAVGNVTISSGGTVFSNATILGANSSGLGTVTMTGGNLTTSGELTVGFGGAGILDLASGTVSSPLATIGLGSAATGTVNVSGGQWTNTAEIFVANNGNGALHLSGGEITTDSVVVARFGGSTGTLNLTGGVLTTGQVAYAGGCGTITFDGGTVRLSADQSNLFAGSAASVAVVGSGGTIDTQSFDVQTFANLTGNGSLNKIGNGTLTLAASNTNNGTLTVNEGTLRFTNFGNVSGDITNQGSVIWSRLDDTSFVQTISGNGSFTQESGILRWTLAQTYTGPTNIDGGILVLPTGVDDALASSSLVTLASGAFLDLSMRTQNMQLEGAGTIYSFNDVGAELRLHVDSGATREFSGTIGGSHPDISVRIMGPGVQIFSGSNTYDNLTFVQGGTLLVNNTSGSGTGTLDVTVQSGAAIGGNGTIGAGLTINAGGLFAIAPTNTLNLNGTLTLDITFGVGSLRDLSGDPVDWSLFVDGTYTLIEGTLPTFNPSTIANFGFANAEAIGGGRFAYFANGSEIGNTQLNLVLVPEPSTSLLLGLGALAALALRRRNGRQTS